MSAYFNLEKSFSFYGAFHSNPVNQWIHIICVPIIFTTSIELLLRVISPICIQILLLFYISSFIYMHALAGITYAPVLMIYAYIGSQVLPNHALVSMVLWVCAWIAQFVGHGVFEKRAPALLTNLPQSVHAAVFFVWVELLMKWKILDSALERKLISAVNREKRKFKH